MFPMMKDHKKKNGEVPTRKEWDDAILQNPKAFEKSIASLLRDKRYPDSEVEKVIAKMHQESQRRKLEKKRRHDEKWDAIFAYARTVNKPPEGTVTSPIIIEDDDDVLDASSSTSRKRRLDTPNSSEQSLSKKQQREKRLDELDEELKKLEEKLKNLPEKQRELGTPSDSDEDTQWSS